MKKLNKPIAMLLFVTLPQLLLALTMTLLILTRDNQKAIWILAASLLCVLLSAVYAFIRRKSCVDRPAYIVMAGVNIVLLAVSVPLLDNSALFDGFISARLLAMLLCSISAVYSMLGLLTSIEDKGDCIKPIIGIAIGPLAFFLGLNLLNGAGLSTAVMILIIAFSYFLLYLLIKVLLVKKKTDKTDEKAQRVKGIALYAVFSLGLPLVGLTLNLVMENMFGDFSHPAFFVIPAINGILLLAPIPKDKRLRLLRFFFLSVSTTYLIYFVIAFIPYIPLGIVGLMIILGGLIFAPAAALVMQTIHIIKEWKQLTQLWNTVRVIAVFLAGLVVLPAILLTSFIGDRANLKTAVAYIQPGPQTTNEAVDLGRLQRSLHFSAANFVEERSWLDMPRDNNRNTPIISWVYSDLVLDHRILSEDSVTRLDRLFFNDFDTRQTDMLVDGLTVGGERRSIVELTEVTTQTEYDAEVGACRTWVHLELQAPSDIWNEEYVTTFSLPEGAYISDYYLDVLNERKSGILADKRAAMWIYRDIVTVREDPGMLRYIKDNTLELRVFPFSKDELRRTGFEVMHADAISLSIDNHVINLPSPVSAKTIEAEGAVVIPAALKQTLPKAAQRPYQYYFVVDCSDNSSVDYRISKIQEFAENQGIDDAEVLFVSYRLEQQCALEDASDFDIATRGGFNLSLAVRRILETNTDKTVPVIIFASGNPAAAQHPDNVSLLAAQYPESPYYYWLRSDLALVPYSLETTQALDPVEKPILSGVLLYNGMRVKDDGHCELVQNKEASLKITGNQYQRAMMLDVASRSGIAQSTADELSLLRASFRANVLTPQTAFIVLETPQQEQQMLEKQEQLMEQDAALAVKESLDEPPLLLCALILAFAAAVLAVRKKSESLKAK